MKNYYVRGLAPLTRVVVGSLALMLSGLSYSAGPGFVDNFEQAAQIARQTGRPIFADFSTSWCGVCKQMERTVFADPNIIARLDNYVKVKVDAEVRTDLSSRFAINAYPTYLYLDPQGRILDRKEGGIRTQEMADALDRSWQSVASQVTVAQANSKRPEMQNVANAGPAGAGRAQVADTNLNLLAAAEKPAAPAASVRESRTSRGGSEPVEQNDPSLGDSVYAMGAGPTSSRRSRFGSGSNENGLRELAEAAANPASIAEGEEDSKTASEKKSTEESEKSEKLASKSDETEEKASVKTAEVAKAAEEEKAKETKTPEVATPSQPALTLKAPTEMAKTDVSPVVESRLQALSEEELPKPLLSRTTGNSPQTLAAATKVSTSASTGDPLATIRRIQGEPVAAKAPLVVASAAPAAPTVMKPVAEKVSVKTAEEKPNTDKPESDSKKPESADAEKSAEKAEEKSSAKSEEKASEKPEPVKKAAASGKNADIERWMKDADAKLLDQRKKEARAMYAKVVENDPKNESGNSDMAYVKMVSLIVDRDSDLLRREAYSKIKQFEARYPDSEHKDYYTLIRAILATDLGETNEAHRLLGTYAERFPDSKYRDAAHKQWKELPPVTKETKKSSASSSSNSKSSSKSSKSSAAASSKSKKSSDS